MLLKINWQEWHWEANYKIGYIISIAFGLFLNKLELWNQAKKIFQHCLLRGPFSTYDKVDYSSLEIGIAESLI